MNQMQNIVPLTTFTPNYPVEDREATFTDELPPVVQFPVVRQVTATFQYVGKHEPLPFPDTDE